MAWTKKQQLAYQKIWYRENREKALAQRKKWRDAHPDYFKKHAVAYKPIRRARDLHRKYGLSSSAHLRMLVLQGGACAICRVVAGRTASTLLCVDHSHTSGCVRALLCGDCNRALGLLNDHIPRLQRAVEYLKTHQDK
jgi:hypothetical protein